MNLRAPRGFTGNIAFDKAENLLKCSRVGFSWREELTIEYLVIEQFTGMVLGATKAGLTRLGSNYPDDRISTSSGVSSLLHQIQHITLWTQTLAAAFNESTDMLV